MLQFCVKSLQFHNANVVQCVCEVLLDFMLILVFINMLGILLLVCWEEAENEVFELRFPSTH